MAELFGTAGLDASVLGATMVSLDLHVLACRGIASVVQCVVALLVWTIVLVLLFGPTFQRDIDGADDCGIARNGVLQSPPP